jgi:hypothetical protein
MRTDVESHSPQLGTPAPPARIRVEEVAEVSAVGAITDLCLVPDPDTHRLSLLAIGRTGAAWLSLSNYQSTRTVSFGTNDKMGPPYPRRAFDTDGDGVPEALEHPNSYDIPKLTVYSTTTGKLLWEYTGESAITMVAPLHDSVLGTRIIVGCRSSFDKDGKSFDRYGRILDGSGGLLERQRWADGDDAHIDHAYLVADVNGDGRDELLYSNSGEFVLRDGSGKLLWRGRPVAISHWVQSLYHLNVLEGAERRPTFQVRVSAEGTPLGPKGRDFLLRLSEDGGTWKGEWTPLSAEASVDHYRAGIGYLVPVPGVPGKLGVLHAAAREDMQGSVYIRASDRQGELIADHKLSVPGGSSFTGCGTVLVNDRDLLIGWGSKLYVAQLVADQGNAVEAPATPTSPVPAR